MTCLSHFFDDTHFGANTPTSNAGIARTQGVIFSAEGPVWLTGAEVMPVGGVTHPGDVVVVAAQVISATLTFGFVAAVCLPR